MSKVWFTPHRRSLICHLAPSMCGPIPVSGDTACGFMSSQNWHSVPVASSSGTLQLLMGNYILVSQEYQSACATWVPMLWKYPQKPWLDRLYLQTKYHQWSTQPGLQKRQTTKHQKVGSWRLWTSQSFTEWPESEQKQARELLLKWEHLFVNSDLDQGKTALIKHKIQFTDQTPFKEHYQHIPSHMYDDMRAHIQEMLDIGAICKLHSLWASTVVLVWKKDGGLRFCIDLRKLNNQTVKDAYSLPQIDETLDSLQGSQWVLLPWPEVWVLAGKNGWGEQTTDSIYSGAIGVLWVWKNAFQAYQHPLQPSRH